MTTLPSTPGGGKTTTDLKSSVPLITNATLYRPMQMANTTDSVQLSGTTLCGAGTPTPGIPCIGTSPPAYTTPVESNVLLIQVTLPGASCTPPGVAFYGSRRQDFLPTPGPTPTPIATPDPTTSCYVVAFEGTVGPYLVQGPAILHYGDLVFTQNTATLHLKAATKYTFYLAYIPGAIPAAPTPTPAPTAPPSANIQPTPTPTPTATPTSSPVPPPSPAPSACPSSQPRTGGDGRGSDGFFVSSEGDRGHEGDGKATGCNPCPSSSDGHSGDGHRGSDGFLISSEGDRSHEGGGKSTGCNPCPSRSDGHSGDSHRGSDSFVRSSEGDRAHEGQGVTRDCNGDYHSNDHNGHGNDGKP